MKLNEFQTQRTKIISNMLDNPDKYGIYPTTKCFEALDNLFLSAIEQPSQPEEVIKALSGEPIIDITTVTSTTYEQPAPEIDLRGELIQFLSETTIIALPEGHDCIDLVDEYLKLKQ